MARRNRPTHLATVQGNNNPIETNEAMWQMRASKGGTTYLTHIGYSRPGTAVSTAGWLISESTYDTSGNLVIRQHANNSTEIADFDQIWDASSAVAISAATKASPCNITTSAAHGYSNGDIIEITGVSGMTELNSDGYGSITFTVTVVDSTHITLGVDSSGYTTYTSGGNCYARTYLNLTYA